MPASATLERLAPSNRKGFVTNADGQRAGRTSDSGDVGRCAGAGAAAHAGGHEYHVSAGKGPVESPRCFLRRLQAPARGRHPLRDLG